MLGLPATCFLLFLSCISTIFAQQHDVIPDDHSAAANNATKLICRPFGNCEPCPDNALHEPFCEPFGNRRLMHCVPASSNSSSSSTTSSSNPHTPAHTPSTSSRDFSNHPPPPRQRQQSPSSSSSSSSPNTKTPTNNKDPPEPETPAWESCGRIVEQERADFWEFVLCNVVFCVLALGMVGVRGRKMKALQARMLAARIGLVRGGGGGGGR